MRPPQGPKQKFSSTSETEMAMYVNYCWEVGLPKTKTRFSQELVHHMEFAGIRNTFPNVQPGTCIFYIYNVIASE